jgi:hypothetical protein
VNPQLAAVFAAHKTAILGAAAAGVAGLALLHRKKGATAGTAAGTAAGTIPAAAVVPSQATGSTYDSSAYDVYSALQSELGPMLQARQGSGITTAPAPVASSLFAPTGSGQYVAYKGTGAGGNSINEVETDGSLYHLGLPEWQSIIAANGGKEPTVATFSGTAPTDFGYTANLKSKIAAGTGTA